MNARPPVIERMLELWNGGDLGAVEGVYAPGVRFDGTAYDHATIREEIDSLRRAFADMRFHVRYHITASDHTVLVLEWAGTHTGTYASPVGDVPATGRTFAVSGVEIFRVDGDRVVETVERSSLRTVQTPQAFVADVFKRALDADGDWTDCAAAVEAAGGRVKVVPGDPRLLKITSAEDLERVAALL
jgi:hypothetical protein